MAANNNSSGAKIVETAGKLRSSLADLTQKIGAAAAALYRWAAEKFRRLTAPHEGQPALVPDKKFWSRAGAVFVTLMALVSVGYFIIGPSRGVYTADCLDSLIWAQASVESGKILSEDFTYAAILPFGSQLWMTPLVAVFGFSPAAQIISMIIFVLIFALSVVLLCRSLGWNFQWCALTLFSVMLMLSGSRFGREIMWCHVIYYSLGLLLLFFALALAVRMSEYSLDDIKGRPRSFWLMAGGMLLLSAGIGTDGFQVIALSLIPAVGAVVLSIMLERYAIFSRRNAGAIIASVLSVTGAAAGILIISGIKGDIAAGYADAFSDYTDVSLWAENAGRFASQYFSLIGVDAHDDMPLASLDSLVNIVRIGAGLLILIMPLVGLLSFGSRGDRATRIAVSAHLLCSATLMFAFVCGSISSANWRLVPMVGTGVLATAATVRWIARSFRPVGTRFAALAMAVVLMAGYVSAAEMLSMPSDWRSYNDHAILAHGLAERDLTYGYATFWNAAPVTFASGSQTQVRNIEMSGEALVPYQYQSMDYWFDDQEGQENYFIALTFDEYAAIAETEYWSSLMSEKYLYSFDCGNYHVTVFYSNPFSSVSG